MKKHEWLTEFDLFLKSAETPSKRVSDSIFRSIHRDLKPSLLSMISKMLFIHLLAAAVTLLFCPQFGFGFGTEGIVMPILMSYGGLVCALGCGASFLSLTGVISALFLSPAELTRIKHWEVFPITLLVAVSWGLGMLTGWDLEWQEQGAWVAGALTGGVISFYFALTLRRLFNRLPFNHVV